MTPIVVNRCHNLCVIIVSPGVRSACFFKQHVQDCSSLTFICNNNFIYNNGFIFYFIKTNYDLYVKKTYISVVHQNRDRYRDRNPNSKLRPSTVWTRFFFLAHVAPISRNPNFYPISGSQKTTYRRVYTVYCKIMCILFIKVFLLKINEITGKVIETPFDNISIQIAIRFKILHLYPIP